MTVEDRTYRLDPTDWTILTELQRDGRVPTAELGRRVGLSSSSTADRVRRLEDDGVIAGYRAVVRPEAVGLGLSAFVRVVTTPRTFSPVLTLARELPEITECHRATGNGCFVLKVHVRDVAHLERVLDRVMPLGEPDTSVVLSSAPLDGVITDPSTWDAAAGREEQERTALT